MFWNVVGDENCVCCESGEKEAAKTCLIGGVVDDAGVRKHPERFLRESWTVVDRVDESG
jgi:hypothetical protein